MIDIALKRNGGGGDGEFGTWITARGTAQGLSNAHEAQASPRNAESRLDEAIHETFPASDPISIGIDDPADDERLEGEPS